MQQSEITLTLKGHRHIMDILKCGSCIKVLTSHPMTTTPRPLPLATAGSR